MVEESKGKKNKSKIQLVAFINWGDNDIKIREIPLANFFNQKKKKNNNTKKNKRKI